MPPVNGNIVSEPHNPLFLLDESLVAAVARALNAVNYRFVTVLDVLGPETKDPEIIAWCREQDAVWVHADDRARKEHRALLQRSGIRTVWVYRKHGRMTGREQLRILSFVLPKLIEYWQQSPENRHYRASAANPLATPGLRRVRI